MKQIAVLLTLLALIQSVILQDPISGFLYSSNDDIDSEDSSDDDDDSPTSRSGSQAVPYLEQEEKGNFNNNGSYLLNGTYYFEDQNKEYKITYVIRETGYDLKKYTIREKSKGETSMNGPNAMNTGFPGPLIGLGQFLLKSSGITAGNNFGQAGTNFPGLSSGSVNSGPLSQGFSTGLGQFGTQSTNFPGPSSGQGFSGIGTSKLSAGFGQPGFGSNQGYTGPSGLGYPGPGSNGFSNGPGAYDSSGSGFPGPSSGPYYSGSLENDRTGYQGSVYDVTFTRKTTYPYGPYGKSMLDRIKTSACVANDPYSSGISDDFSGTTRKPCIWYPKPPYDSTYPTPPDYQYNQYGAGMAIPSGFYSGDSSGGTAAPGYNQYGAGMAVSSGFAAQGGYSGGSSGGTAAPGPQIEILNALLAR